MKGVLRVRLGLRSLVIALAVLLLSPVGASQEAAAQQNIPVHIFSPFSGPIAFYGPTIRQGIELAIQENQDALSDRTIDLIDVDDECRPERAVSELNRILDEALILAGPVCTGNMLAIQQLLVQNEIPHIFTGYGAVVTKQDDPYIFAASVSDETMARAIVAWARENRDIRRWAVIHDTTGYGSAGARTFQAVVEATEGAELVETVSYNPGEREYTGLLTNLDQANPDAIYVIGYEVDLGIMVKQAGQAGISAPLVGSPAFVNPELAQAAGDHANGIPFVAMMLPSQPNDAMQEFVNNYREAYGDTPKDTGTIGYITGLVLIDALSRIDGEVTRENLTEALRATNIERSPVGPIRFGESGARVGEELSVIGIIENNEPRFLTRY